MIEVSNATLKGLVSHLYSIQYEREEIIMKDHLPAYKKVSFMCPHCKVHTGHKFRDLYLCEEEMFSGYNQFPPYELLTIEYPDPSDGNAETQAGESAVQAEDTNWHVSICYSCKKSSFWEGTVLVYPVPADPGFPEPSKEMPEKVAELYREASAVFPISKRASAALMRAAAEKLVFELTKDSLPQKMNLDGRVKHLSKTVPEDIFKALTVIRVLGNKVLHQKDEEVESVTIFLDEDTQGLPQALANSLNALVNQFIVNRRLIDEMYKIMPDSVLGQLDRIIKEYKTRGEDNV